MDGIRDSEAADPVPEPWSDFEHPVSSRKRKASTANLDDGSEGSCEE